MRIKILTTGGTIDKVYFDARGAFEIGEPVAARVLDEARVSVDYELIQLMRKDSLDLTRADRQTIVDYVQADSCRRFVITHGTDTMTDTGEALQTVTDKVMVLTGALNPARFRSSDAIFNLGMAFAAVQVLDAGVYITMNGQVFRAAEVRKNPNTNSFEPIDQSGCTSGGFNE